MRKRDTIRRMKELDKILTKRPCYKNCHLCSDEEGTVGFNCVNRMHEWTLKKRIAQLHADGKIHLRHVLEKSMRLFFKHMRFPHMFLFEDPIISQHTNCAAFAMMDLTAQWTRRVFDAGSIIAQVRKTPPVKRNRDGDIMVWYKRDSVEGEFGRFHMAICHDGRYLMKDGIDGEVTGFSKASVEKEMKKRGYTHQKRILRSKFKPPIVTKRSVFSNVGDARRIERRIKSCIKKREWRSIIRYFEGCHEEMIRRNLNIPTGNHEKEKEKRRLRTQAA